MKRLLLIPLIALFAASPALAAGPGPETTTAAENDAEKTDQTGDDNATEEVPSEESEVPDRPAPLPGPFVGPRVEDAGPAIDVGELAQRVRVMKPKAAAAMLTRMPVELTSKILLSISARDAARIMNYMPPPVAARVAAHMAGVRPEEGT